MDKIKLEHILKSIFSIFVFVAIVGSAITFVIFLAAFIIGGEGGEKLAVDASKLYLPYFIRAATIAVASGLLMFYTTGDHALSIKKERVK
jgi:hypothetical protein